jgi:predicted dehydrogenase
LGVYTTQQVSAYSSRLSLYGTQGVLHINRFGQELHWQNIVDTHAAKAEGPTLTPIEFEGPHPFSTALQEELEDFADCIRNGGQPLVGADAGIDSLRIIRAIMESSDTGRAITLD